MTVSHLTRSRDQLWSDLLVALGGSEAFLSRSISERRILLEIMETFSVTVSTKDIDDLDELLEQVVIAAGGSASHLRQNKHEMLAALVTALGGTPPSASFSSTGELLAACVNAVDTAGGGGGPTPDFRIDFKNGTGLDQATYDPDKLTPGVGIVAGASQVIVRLAADALSLAAADPVGCILVVRGSLDVGSNYIGIDLHDGGYVTDLNPSIGYTTGASTGLLRDYDHINENISISGVGAHALATLFSPTALIASADGQANVTGSNPAIPAVVTVADLTVVLGVIERIDVYSLASLTASDLPTLSAP